MSAKMMSTTGAPASMMAAMTNNMNGLRFMIKCHRLISFVFVIVLCIMNYYTILVAKDTTKFFWLDQSLFGQDQNGDGYDNNNMSYTTAITTTDEQEILSPVFVPATASTTTTGRSNYYQPPKYKKSSLLLLRDIFHNIYKIQDDGSDYDINNMQMPASPKPTPVIGTCGGKKCFFQHQFNTSIGYLIAISSPKDGEYDKILNKVMNSYKLALELEIDYPHIPHYYKEGPPLLFEYNYTLILNRIKTKTTLLPTTNTTATATSNKQKFYYNSKLIRDIQGHINSLSKNLTLTTKNHIRRQQNLIDKQQNKLQSNGTTSTNASSNNTAAATTTKPKASTKYFHKFYWVLNKNATSAITIRPSLAQSTTPTPSAAIDNTRISTRSILIMPVAVAPTPHTLITCSLKRQKNLAVDNLNDFVSQYVLQQANDRVSSISDSMSTSRLVSFYNQLQYDINYISNMTLNPNYDCLLQDFQFMVDKTGKLHHLDLDRCFPGASPIRYDSQNQKQRRKKKGYGGSGGKVIKISKKELQQYQNKQINFDNLDQEKEHESNFPTHEECFTNLQQMMNDFKDQFNL